jgi:hypothetical protein
MASGGGGGGEGGGSGHLLYGCVYSNGPESLKIMLSSSATSFSSALARSPASLTAAEIRDEAGAGGCCELMEGRGLARGLQKSMQTAKGDGTDKAKE